MLGEERWNNGKNETEREKEEYELINNNTKEMKKNYGNKTKGEKKQTNEKIKHEWENR